MKSGLLRRALVVGFAAGIGATGCSGSPTAPDATPSTPVSAAAGNTVTINGGSGASSLENQVLVLVNQQRATGAVCGGTAYPPVGPLYMNANLQAAAEGHSQEMAANGYVSHDSLDGSTFDQRISAAGYSGVYPWGEDIAAGQSTPGAVVAAFMSSADHCVNIMTGDFHAAGVGYASNSSSTYHYYWTIDFGGS